MADDLTAELEEIRGLITRRDQLLARMNAASFDDAGSREVEERFTAAQDKLTARVPRLLAAVEAVLEQVDDLTRKSEALDAEAEYIAGEHPEAAAVAVLKRERSIAYDECARWFRETITRALNGESRGGHPL